MTDHEKPELGDTTKSGLIRVASSVVGTVPVVGPVIQAVVSEVIPNTRIERLENFVLHLESRMSETELIIALETPEGLDTFEEGLWQAARAISDQRRDKIAGLVAKGLESQGIERMQARHYLRILNQLSDEDIAILIEHGQNKRHFFDSRFSVPYGENPSEEMEKRRALDHSQQKVLTAYGLLQASEEGIDSAFFILTRTGREFLSFLGIKVEDTPPAFSTENQEN